MGHLRRVFKRGARIPAWGVTVRPLNLDCRKYTALKLSDHEGLRTAIEAVEVLICRFRA